MKTLVVTAALACFIGVSLARAEEGFFYAFDEIPDPLPSGKALKLSMEDAVFRALEANYDVELQRLDVDISNALVLGERGVFEPELFGEGGKTSRSGGDGVDTESGEIGLRTRLVTGTDISLRSSFSDSSVEDTEGTGEARLDVTQPLLRDVGIKTTRARLVTAKTNLQISWRDLEQQMIDTISDVQNTYWDLVSVGASLNVQKESRKSARDLEELVRERVAAGRVPESDTIEAQAEVYGREADVARAEENVRFTEDRLKELLVLFNEPDNWNAPIEATTEPVVPEEDPAFLPALRVALDRRPDYRSEMLRLKNDDLALYVAKNGLLPRLDLVASGSSQVLGDGPGTGFDAVGGGEEEVWSVFLRVELPLGNKEARAERDQALAQREQRLFRLKQVELEIIREIRRAVDAVGTSRLVVEAQAKAVEFEQLKLDNEHEKLRLGKSDTDTVVRFIQSLNRARLNYIDATVRYNQALVRLDQSQGTTLDRFGIVLEN